MPTIAVVEDDRNILTSASMALETGGVRDRHICGRLLSSRRFEIKSAGSSPAGLDRISHTNRRIGPANQRKLLCRNDLTQIRGESRCRQSVARNRSILELWKVAV